MAQAAAATPPPPPVGTPVVAKFAFKAQHKDQLSFEKGATLLIVSDQNRNGWWHGSHAGQAGFFPHNYVTLPPAGGAAAPGAEAGRLAANAAPSREPADVPASRPAGPLAGPEALPVIGEERVALFNFDAVEREQMSFRAGDAIAITATIDRNGWWKGRLVHNPTVEGYFPALYTKPKPEPAHGSGDAGRRGRDRSAERARD
eukprot:EG_transcript_29444